MSEKVPEMIAQFQDLLTQSKDVFEQEYDVLVGNIVGAWADILTAQGKSVPEYVASLLEMTNQGKAAYGEVATSLEGLIQQYQNGQISAEEFYAQSEPLFEQLKNFNSDGSIDETVASIKDLGGALDMSQYMTDGALDTTKFKAAIDEVVKTANDGKTNLSSLGEENAQTISNYKQQLEALGVDMGSFDFASLYGASDAQVQQGKTDIDTAYKAYADQVQYCLLQELPSLIEQATQDYDTKLSPFEKIFTTKEDYVNGVIQKWKDNTLTPAISTIQESMNQLGIDGQPWAEDAANKMTGSLFETFTEDSYEGVQLTSTTLKSDWESQLKTSLNELGQSINAEGYGKQLVDDYNTQISNNASSSVNTVSEWKNDIDGEIGDGSLPSTAGKCARDIISSFNTDVANNSQSSVTQMTSYRTSIGNSFAGVKEDFKGIGANIIAGLNEGMNSKFGEVATTATNIAKNVSQSVRSTLGIHSPSRVMKELGVYTMQGFQNGLELLYQPITSSLEQFGTNLTEAPSVDISSMYGGYSPNQLETGGNTYSALDNNTYNRDNAETNALLRELIVAVKQGSTIEVNGKTLGQTVRKEAKEYFSRTGNPMFEF